MFGLLARFPDYTLVVIDTFGLYLYFGLFHPGIYIIPIVSFLLGSYLNLFFTPLSIFHYGINSTGVSAPFWHIPLNLASTSLWFLFHFDLLNFGHYSTLVFFHWFLIVFTSICFTLVTAQFWFLFHIGF